MAVRGAETPPWKSWRGLVYYGEAVGFLLAWVAGIAALSYATPTVNPQPLDRVAAVEAAVADR